MTKYLVIVCADTNDADYVERSVTLTSEQLEEFKYILSILDKNVGGLNWNNQCGTFNELYAITYKDRLTSTQAEFLNNIVPYDIHTIESVKVYEYTSEYTL